MPLAMRRLDPGSTRLAFLLLAFLALQILVSAFVPQVGFTTGEVAGWRARLAADQPVVQRLWLDRIYFSPSFYATLGLLALNLTVGNVRRVGVMRRARSLRRRLQVAGSVVFHLSLLVVLVGVALNSLYRFDRVLGLTEGQMLPDLPGRHFREFGGVLAAAPRGDLAVHLLEADRRFEVRDSETAAARVRVIPRDGDPVQEGLVYINHPLRWRDLELHLGSMVGYSPELVVIDRDERVVFRNFVRLQVTGGDVGMRHEDFVPLPDAELEARIRIEPDRADAPPRRFLTVAGHDSTLFSGAVVAGDTVTAGGYRFVVPRVKNWCYIHIVRNPWLIVVFAGFWSGLCGLALSVIARTLPTNGSSA